MRAGSAGEAGRALRRLALIGALVAGWSGYAAGVPAPAGIEALRAAFAKAKPKRPSSAKVSWSVEDTPAAGAARAEPAR
ncbi:MAG: hypothetical protein HYV14_10330 [Elusimicrobia bacterium]|nr:hypothetical protein [Elusimicrobiota bacterium]